MAVFRSGGPEVVTGENGGSSVHFGVRFLSIFAFGVALVHSRALFLRFFVGDGSEPGERRKSGDLRKMPVVNGLD